MEQVFYPFDKILSLTYEGIGLRSRMGTVISLAGDSNTKLREEFIPVDAKTTPQQLFDYLQFHSSRNEQQRMKSALESVRVVVNHIQSLPTAFSTCGVLRVEPSTERKLQLSALLASPSGT